MGSVSVHRFFIVLSILLISSFIIIDVTDASWNTKARRGHPPRQPPKNDLHLSSPEECSRECRMDEPPKICYYHFELEFYSVLGGACDLCTPEDVNSGNCTQCVTADGVERTILTVNRMLPGPSIRVCLGDKVVIDVENHMHGLEVTIHWHGVYQKGSQYYDGVPFVTQCPILYGNTFRYQWFANNEGTHFWHAHDGMHKMDGIYGSLVVVPPRCRDPNSNRYDYDLPNHVMLVSDLFTGQLTAERFPGRRGVNLGQWPDSFLFNGKGKFTDPVTGISTNTTWEVFTVKAGYRYRFRFINSCCSTCPVELTFEKHTPLLISIDGEPVEPVKIGSTITVAGERTDFVINANQPPASYWILLRALGGCATDKTYQLAILRYEGTLGQPSSAQPTYDNFLPTGVVLGRRDDVCNETRDDAICISQLKTARPVDKRILTRRADATFTYEVNFADWDPKKLYRSKDYYSFLVPAGDGESTALVNNITYRAPTSPLLSQFDDNPRDGFCNITNRPSDCGEPCKCTQMIHVPRKSMIEWILVDRVGVGILSHPIHFHGHAFHVMGMGKSPYQNVTRMRASHARELDKQNKLRRNFDRPPVKDTVAIPTGGYVVIRFCADNPGYWLLHCHFLFHQLVGMEMILHVGDDEKDLPPIPPNFPKCGNHLPRIEPLPY